MVKGFYTHLNWHLMIQVKCICVCMYIEPAARSWFLQAGTGGDWRPDKERSWNTESRVRRYEKRGSQQERKHFINLYLSKVEAAENTSSVIDRKKLFVKSKQDHIS